MERQGGRWSRRQFVAGAGAAGLGLLAGCGRLPWQAAPAARVHRVGVLSTAAGELNLPPPPGANANYDALVQGLREYGYVEGQNLSIEYRSTSQGEWQVREFAAELARLPVDVIVAGAGASLPAKQATDTVPIVFATGPDPVALGLVPSIARPEGNVTGITVGVQGASLVGKRLELLKAAVPTLSRVAVLEDANDVPPAPILASREAAAQTLGVDLVPMNVRSAEGLASAFNRVVQAHADGLLNMDATVFRSSRAQVTALMLTHRLPSIAGARESAEAGGLMSYGSNLNAALRRAAYYVNRILTGTRPADLPVEQAMTFDFVVNMKTAQALGITFPNEILLQVTEVIQ
jgi:putative ABC transport system substrate-binding protein